MPTLSDQVSSAVAVLELSADKAKAIVETDAVIETDAGARNSLPKVIREAEEALTRRLNEFMATYGGSFTSGFTVQNRGQLFYYENAGQTFSYMWAGSPMALTVAAGSAPSDYGVIGADWIDKTTDALRTDLANNDSDVLIAGVTAKEIRDKALADKGNVKVHYLDDYAGSTVINTGINDATAAFVAAKTTLGVSTLCYLKQGGTYYFSGSRPDLSGLAIYSEVGAKIKTDANPNIKTMTLVNDATINNTIHATTLTKHGNLSHDYLVAAGASVDRLSVKKRLTKKTFGDSDITLASITNGTVDNEGAFTGVNNSTYLSWNSSFPAGQQGAFLPVELGALFEAAYRHIGEATQNISSFRSVALITSTQRIDFAVYTGQALAKILVSTGTSGSPTTTIYKEIILPNGLAYSLANNGAVTLGVRVTDKSVEFYINGTMIEKYAYAGEPGKVAFLTSWYESDLCQILHPTKTKVFKPVSSKPVSIAIVGDSISYGAWASESYDVILKNTLEHSGLGTVTATNYAVSGTTTSNWLDGGSADITTKDLTGRDYVLLMLGTNDVQSGITGITFEANMRTLISYIQSQGAVPVLGVFPVWTTSDVSGVVGVETNNYAVGGWHRQIIKMLAAELGLPLADVCAHIGTNIGMYGDNIHPTEHGQISVAAAFAEAILSHSTPELYVPNTTSNSSAALTHATGILSSDITLDAAGSYYDCASVALTAGTWLLNAHATVFKAGSAAVFLGRISDGTTHHASSGASTTAISNTVACISMSSIVILASPATIKLQVTALVGSSGSLVKAATPTYGAGTNATKINAIKIG